jgi:hypothetical protein
MHEMSRRIAMWSGPRNISTALLRSWGNRADTFVCDEPLYSHYLLVTGLPHPGADEIIRHHESDWRKVVAWLTGDIPEGKTIFYQKHMSHHLLPQIDRAWLDQVDNVFLIREPREVVTSLAKVLPNPRLEDSGYPQQWEIFCQVRQRTGRTPAVIDARDVLEDPRRLLTRLCQSLEVPFDEAMLSWPSGPRATDGIWAPHWYDAVVKTTTFGPYRPKNETVPDNMHGLLTQADDIYRRLYEHRLS